MKSIITVFLISFFSNVFSQEFVNDTTNYKRYKVEAGVLVPLGSLSSKIGVSQNYGFWYRTRIEHNDLLDLGFNIIIPNVESSFIYKGKDSIFNVKAKGISIKAGCRMNKLYALLNKKVTIEWSSGFGASFFSFEDKENPEDTSGYYADEEGGSISYRY